MLGSDGRHAPKAFAPRPLGSVATWRCKNKERFGESSVFPSKTTESEKPTAGKSKKNVYLSLVPEYLSDAGHGLRDCEVTGLNTARMISLSVQQTENMGERT